MNISGKNVQRKQGKNLEYFKNSKRTTETSVVRKGDKNKG